MLQSIIKHRYAIFLGIIVFFTMYYFFAIVHPIYPYDADDWTYLHNWRDIYPSTEKYNPTRILPEILMPLCGELSMLLVYPLVHDISIAVCITSSFILSLSITLYILLFYNFLKKKILLRDLDGFIVSLVFLTFHFFLFLKSDTENQHLFYSFDLCCHFNYTLPNIFASCFVLLFMTKKYEDINFKGSYLKFGFLFVGLYLVVLSHVFSNIILVAYLSIYLLFSLPQLKEGNIKISVFLKKYSLHISIIALWLVVLLFEANGSRANAVHSIDPTPISVSISHATRNMAYMIFQQTNYLAICIITFFFLSFLFLSYKNPQLADTKKNIRILMSSAFICCVYLILMAAVSYPYYLLRLMTLFATPYFILLASFVCISAFVKQYRGVIALFPILLFPFIYTQRNGSTFQDIQTLYIEQEIQGTYKVSPQDILEQNTHNIQCLIDADLEGIEKPNIVVPKFNHYENWPLANYYAYRLARFLFKFGLLSAPLRATITPQKNEVVSSSENDRYK